MYKKDARFYLELLNSISDGIYFVDKERRIQFWNKSAENITGFRSEEVTGSFCYDNILNHIDDTGKRLCVNGCPLWATLKDGRHRESEVFLHHKDRHRVPVKIKIAPMIDENGEITGAVEIFSDDTQNRLQAEEIEKLHAQALLDELTSIPNRRFLDLTLNMKLGEYKRYGTQCGVIFMDIDDFKGINDTYSHLTGDKILQIVSNTIHANIRTYDFAGRWGGDEFLIILSRIDEENLRAIANKITVLIGNSNYYTNAGEHIPVSVSSGAVMITENDTVMSILEKADELLYKSKKRGKGCVSM